MPAPLSFEVHHIVGSLRLLVLHHLSRCLVNDLNLAEVSEEVSVVVHVKLSVIVKGESEVFLQV